MSYLHVDLFQLVMRYVSLDNSELVQFYSHFVDIFDFDLRGSVSGLDLIFRFVGGLLVGRCHFRSGRRQGLCLFEHVQDLLDLISGNMERGKTLYGTFSHSCWWLW